jgi:hypothetical protein
MLDYRLYFHDRRGRITSVFAFPCVADDEAVSIALRRLAGAPGELWELDRKVCEFGRDGLLG